MVISMKANGSKTREVVKDFLSGRQENSLRESGRTTKEKEKAL